MVFFEVLGKKINFLNIYKVIKYQMENETLRNYVMRKKEMQA